MLDLCSAYILEGEEGLWWTQDTNLNRLLRVGCTKYGDCSQQCWSDLEACAALESWRAAVQWEQPRGPLNYVSLTETFLRGQESNGEVMRWGNKWWNREFLRSVRSCLSLWKELFFAAVRKLFGLLLDRIWSLSTWWWILRWNGNLSL